MQQQEEEGKERKTLKIELKLFRAAAHNRPIAEQEGNEWSCPQEHTHS